MMNALTAEDRYRRDPVFGNLVDLLELMIRDLQLTGTEIREAAMLAVLHEHDRRVRWVEAGPDAAIAPRQPRHDWMREQFDTEPRERRPPHD
jgi:hypothetical protein